MHEGKIASAAADSRALQEEMHKASKEADEADAKLRNAQEVASGELERMKVELVYE